MKYCYFNGKITTIDRIKISPYDIGILRGYGVFDVMCTANGKPFLLNEHFRRLNNSARELKLKVPFSKKEFEKIIAQLLKSNNQKEATIRTVLTGGVSADGFSIGNPTCYILVEKKHAFSADAYGGARLISIENKLRNPKAKATLNYVEAIKAQKEKKKKKAHEIIYFENGNVLECSTSNVFLVKDHKIITAKDKILNGTTRGLVIKLAAKKFKVEEREIKTNEIWKSDEVFLVATSKKIVPVIKIDNKKIGHGKPGPITKELMMMYDEFVRNY